MFREAARPEAAPREGSFFALVGACPATQPHEKEAFSISWGPVRRPSPTRRKLFQSRGGLSVDPAPREGGFSDLVGACPATQPYEKEAFKKTWGRQKNERLQCRSSNSCFCTDSAASASAVRGSPRKRSFLKSEGQKKQVPCEGAPRKRSF